MKKADTFLLRGGQYGDWKIQEKPVQPKLEAKLKYILILNTNICSPWLPSTHHTTCLATRSIYLSQYWLLLPQIKQWNYYKHWQH